jgi:hypothetical protein
VNNSFGRFIGTKESMNDKIPQGPHSLRNYNPCYGLGSNIDSFYKNRFSIEKDQVIWRLEIPDVAEPLVYTEYTEEGHFLCVETPKDTVKYHLTLEEEVADATLALGVLTITIDRNINRIPVTVRNV